MKKVFGRFAAADTSIAAAVAPTAGSVSRKMARLGINSRGQNTSPRSHGSVHSSFTRISISVRNPLSKRADPNDLLFFFGQALNVMAAADWRSEPVAAPFQGTTARHPDPRFPIRGQPFRSGRVRGCIHHLTHRGSSPTDMHRARRC